MKQLLRYCFVLCALVFTHAAMAQDRTISGKVTSLEDGSGLPGVSVVIKGTSTGTATDANGTYKINVPANANTLVFSFIGFLTKEVAVGSNVVLNIALEVDNKMLSEVVVTGYGVAQNKRELTGAIATVKGSAFENLPVQSFDRALQGRAAGVQITGLSGQPGGAITVRVRGTGSINAGNDPLYIVDGVQVASGGLSGQSSSNVLNSINPNDIESIEVLKDAAAASIYGAQAANGVVLITTKRGKSGKTQFNFSANEGFVEPIGVLDVLSAQEFATLKQEAFVNRELTRGSSAATIAAQRQASINSFGDPATVQNTDWQSQVYRRASVRTYDLSANGGDEKTKFYMAASYNRSEGQIIKSDFTRGTFRLNVDHKASNKLSFETSIGLSTTTQNGTVSDGAFISSPQFASALILPNQPVFNDDGTFNAPLAGAFNFNPVQSVAFETRKGVTTQTVSNLAVNYLIRPNLKYRAFVGLDYANNRDDNYRDPIVPQFGVTGGSAVVTNRTTLNWNTNHTLNYFKKFGGVHNINALVGAEYRQEVRETVQAQGQGFPNGLFTTLAAAARPITTTGNYTTWRIASLFSQVKYDYKEKYFATATLRYDGSSRFGADNRYGLFYAGSLGWLISQEDFMKDISFINELKLRASYGVNGNSQIDNFASRSLFGLGGQYLDLPGISPSQLGNRNLGWELAKTTNIGLDFGFFNSRVTGSIDAYSRRNERLLLNRQLPVDSGFGSITENVGVVRNRGIEFVINTVNVDAGGFKWTTSFNISFQDNKVISLSEGRDRIGNTIQVGKSLGILWQPSYAGVNPADGRSMWYDSLNNITYSPVARDFRIQGYTLPRSFGGLTNTISYKGFTLDVFFQAQFGNIALNNNGFFMENSATSGWNNLRSQLVRWQKPGDITWVPRPIEGGVEPGSASVGTFSSKQTESGSYIRLKQMTLAYNLPSGLLSKMNLRSARVFVQGLNLLTYTSYTGLDPELLTSEIGTYPQARQFMAGLSIGF